MLLVKLSAKTLIEIYIEKYKWLKVSLEILASPHFERQLDPLVEGGPYKVKKTARGRNRYNQVPHLSQDTKWESNNITTNITNNSQEASLFPSGDHNATINKRESMASSRHNTTNDSQKKYRLRTVSKNILPDGLNWFQGATTLFKIR